MVLYAANPNAIISPTVIIILGTLAFCFSMLDIIIDLFVHWETCLNKTNWYKHTITTLMSRCNRYRKVIAFGAGIVNKCGCGCRYLFILHDINIFSYSGKVIKRNTT